MTNVLKYYILENNLFKNKKLKKLIEYIIKNKIQKNYKGIFIDSVDLLLYRSFTEKII